MPAITLAQAFGSNASISGGVLSIPLADLASVGLSKASPSASEIFTALILRIRAAQGATTQEDIEVGIFVGDPFLTISRNDTQLERQFPVSVYTPLNIPVLDPDDVIG